MTQTSLTISETMNLSALADCMGGATADEAHQMRALLVCCGWEGKTTRDVPDPEWLALLDEAAYLAAR